MHEYAIASEIWAAVLASVRRRGGGRVRAVTLALGALNLIEEEQLRFWLQALAERDGSPDLAMRATTLPARVLCGQCGAESETAAPAGELDHFLLVAPRCPRCGSAEVSVVGGRELWVVSAEVEVHDGDC